MFKVQRLQFGSGPWVDDICGKWVEFPARRWVAGLTREEADAYANRANEQAARDPRCPPRRVVPYSDRFEVEAVEPAGGSLFPGSEVCRRMNPARVPGDQPKLF